MDTDQSKFVVSLKKGMRDIHSNEEMNDAVEKAGVTILQGRGHAALTVAMSDDQAAQLVGAAPFLDVRPYEPLKLLQD